MRCVPEHSLKDLDGTTDAEVNLGNETVRVEYDPTRLKLADLEKAVTDVCCEVMHERITIKVGRMTYAMCVRTIADALERLDGITGSNVNLSSEKAYVTYNPYMTDGIQDEKSHFGCRIPVPRNREKKMIRNKLCEREN
ncbi:MAG: Heavy-metal-associated domain protein [Candidatus Argoarchaeum ethanivorans]|uniref:Heavy-metal-associated domain protein n=1 Tax=Candidatus Argoarchaeum ethanivorans TaxID=2608793 RepID=A0A811T4Q1_9EURY|nr:MAG: Heavy-metal-associated domain protein [Candidatus Argoarchaeum ethanivorans]